MKIVSSSRDILLPFDESGDHHHNQNIRILFGVRNCDSSSTLVQIVCSIHHEEQVATEDENDEELFVKISPSFYNQNIAFPFLPRGVEFVGVLILNEKDSKTKKIQIDSMDNENEKYFILQKEVNNNNDFVLSSSSDDEFSVIISEQNSSCLKTCFIMDTNPIATQLLLSSKNENDFDHYFENAISISKISSSTSSEQQQQQPKNCYLINHIGNGMALLPEYCQNPKLLSDLRVMMPFMYYYCCDNFSSDHSENEKEEEEEVEIIKKMWYDSHRKTLNNSSSSSSLLPFSAKDGKWREAFSSLMKDESKNKMWIFDRNNGEGNRMLQILNANLRFNDNKKKNDVTATTTSEMKNRNEKNNLVDQQKVNDDSYENGKNKKAGEELQKPRKRRIMFWMIIFVVVVVLILVGGWFLIS